MTYGPKPKPVAERFWSKVDKSGDCWLWTGTKMRDYGSFRINSPRRKVLAHRMAWELTHGPVPDGIVVRHRCDNPTCCNPEHLEIGTQADNMRDMHDRGRHWRQQS